nr:hypothetical protein [Tanacetum cinerariifolium]
ANDFGMSVRIKLSKLFIFSRVTGSSINSLQHLISKEVKWLGVVVVVLVVMVVVVMVVTVEDDCLVRLSFWRHIFVSALEGYVGL